METFLGLRFLACLLTAPWTELSSRREVFAAGQALADDKDLVAAVRTEPCALTNRLVAVSASWLGIGRYPGLRGPEGIGKHGGHHEAKAHAHSRPCLSLRL